MDAELDLQVGKLRRPVIRYHGGKWRLGPWIISHFPEHKVYVEAFGGGASVLLQKKRSAVEIYNDLDSEIVELFRILRDPELARRLAAAVALTPFSRAEFVRAYDEPSDDAIENARRMLARAFFGFGSHSHNRANTNGFRSGMLKDYAGEWKGVPIILRRAVARMRGVSIEQMDARALILKMDNPETLFFLDPPYVHSTRDDHHKGYAAEMSTGEHIMLAQLLQRIKGKVVLCGYPSVLYEQLYADWRKVTKQTSASSQNGSTIRTECLWMNFAA